MARKALVVEDDPAIRQLMAIALSGEDCTVVEAADGHAALEAAAREVPDVILLDIGLPDLDGLSVLATLKADAALRRTPVLVVTAWADPDTVRQAMDRGAADYVCKPFALDDLLARVDACIAHDDAEGAAVDAATGLPDRRHLEVVLAREAAAARRSQRPFAVTLVDLDGYDTLYERYGAPAGDDLLRAVAKRFRARVAVADLIARYDARTLALVGPGLDLAAACARAEQLRTDLATRPLDTQAGPIDATACFGVAVHEPTEQAGVTLLRADGALRAAMAAGADTLRADHT